MNVWGDSTHHLKRQFDHCTHFCTTMQQSHTAWNTIAYLWHQNVALIKPDVATQQSGLKPGELYHLGGPALLVVCSLHLPKILEFYLRIQMLPAKL